MIKKIFFALAAAVLLLSSYCPGYAGEFYEYKGNDPRMYFFGYQMGTAPKFFNQDVDINNPFQVYSVEKEEIQVISRQFLPVSDVENSILPNIENSILPNFENKEILAELKNMSDLSYIDKVLNKENFVLQLKNKGYSDEEIREIVRKMFLNVYEIEYKLIPSYNLLIFSYDNKIIGMMIFRKMKVRSFITILEGYSINSSAGVRFDYKYSEKSYGYFATKQNDTVFFGYNKEQEVFHSQIFNLALFYDMKNNIEQLKKEYQSR